MFGCLSCCYEWAVVKESKHARKYGVDSPPVLINSEWTKYVNSSHFLDIYRSLVHSQTARNPYVYRASSHLCPTLPLWFRLVLLIKGVDVVVAGFLWAILLGNYDQLLVLSQYSVQQVSNTCVDIGVQ